MRINVIPRATHPLRTRPATPFSSGYERFHRHRTGGGGATRCPLATTNFVVKVTTTFAANEEVDT